MVNDWQLSEVVSYQIGNRDSVGYSYVNGGSQLNIIASRITPAGPSSPAIQVQASNPYKQFDTSAFAGPPVGSVGLESGQNYLTGCWDKFWDFALARTLRLGGSRQVQLRLLPFSEACGRRSDFNSDLGWFPAID